MLQLHVCAGHVIQSCLTAGWFDKTGNLSVTDKKGDLLGPVAISGAVSLYETVAHVYRGGVYMYSSKHL